MFVILMALFGWVALAWVFRCYNHQLKQVQDIAESNKTIRKDVQALFNSHYHLGEHLQTVEQDCLKALNERDDFLAHAQPSIQHDSVYEQANKMMALGAKPDEIMSSFGISFAETMLISALKSSRNNQVNQTCQTETR